MTTDQRHAYTIRLDEAKLGMLDPRRRDRRLRAAQRLCRIHVGNAANALQMTPTDWSVSTFDDDAPNYIAVRVSALFIPWQPIPPELLAGPTSAEAFRAWEAPRRAVYEAARAAAIERLEPAFEQLGRMIDEIANPPRYVTVDEEHVITADQLAEVRPTTWVPLIEPGRIWTTSTADRPSDAERRHLAARYLAATGNPLDGHVILGLEQVFTAHNLDLVRQWMTDAYPAMRDPSTPTRCTCGDLDWPADLTGERFIAAAGWAHRLNSPCHRMIRDEPQA